MEDYSQYKGLNRYDSKLYEYDTYAKLYIRADNRSSGMKRTFSSIYLVLKIIFF